MKKYTRVHTQKKVTLLKKHMVLCGIILMLFIQGMVAVGSSPVLAAVPSATPAASSTQASQTARTVGRRCAHDGIRRHADGGESDARGGIRLSGEAAGVQGDERRSGARSCRP